MPESALFCASQRRHPQHPRPAAHVRPAARSDRTRRAPRGDCSQALLLLCMCCFHACAEPNMLRLHAADTACIDYQRTGISNACTACRNHCQQTLLSSTTGSGPQAPEDGVAGGGGQRGCGAAAVARQPQPPLARGHAAQATGEHASPVWTSCMSSLIPAAVPRACVSILARLARAAGIPSAQQQKSIADVCALQVKAHQASSAAPSGSVTPKHGLKPSQSRKPSPVRKLHRALNQQACGLSDMVFHIHRPVLTCRVWHPASWRGMLRCRPVLTCRV